MIRTIVHVIKRTNTGKKSIHKKVKAAIACHKHTEDDDGVMQDLTYCKRVIFWRVRYLAEN